MNTSVNKTIDAHLYADSAPLVNNVFCQQSEHAIKLRSSNTSERIKTLVKFKRVFQKYTQSLIDAAKKDLNKPETETNISEIFPVIHEINHTVRHLKKWMKKKSVGSTLAMTGTKGSISYEPKGVCLIISPWNYPINLTFCPLISAIAAGNTAMIKPSELTPNLSKVISQIVNECFSSSEVAVFEGEVDIALALLDLPFDHIFFTGSPQVGSSVMSAAAKNLTSVTLELGGKSPTIIDHEVNLKKAVQKITWAKFSNNGQTCIAPDYVLVHESIVDDFLKEVRLQISNVYGECHEDIKNSKDYCRIVSVSHSKRLKELLDDAKSKKAKVICGGLIEEYDRFVPPTVVYGEDSDIFDSRLMKEEIFGPILPVISYNSIEEAIAIVNGYPKPLALYIYSKNKERINKVIQETSSGGICINHSVVQFLHNNLPFGGVNNSGIGSSHGIFGFKAFSHERAVLEDKFSITHWLFPPYKKRVRILVKMLIKYLS